MKSILRHLLTSIAFVFLPEVAAFGGQYWTVQARYRDEPFTWKDDVSYLIVPGEDHPDSLDRARDRARAVKGEEGVTDVRIVKTGEMSAADANDRRPPQPVGLAPFRKIPPVELPPYKPKPITEIVGTVAPGTALDASKIEGAYNNPTRTPDQKLLGRWVREYTGTDAIRNVPLRIQETYQFKKDGTVAFARVYDGSTVDDYYSYSKAKFEISEREQAILIVYEGAATPEGRRRGRLSLRYDAALAKFWPSNDPEAVFTKKGE